ncbi:hypothetical protein OQA88_5365 [Cercophora sp. LCS_1]
MRQRIDRLESLVKQLVTEREREAPKPIGDDDAHSGKALIQDGHSVHLGTSDWQTVLDEINALKMTYTDQHAVEVHETPDLDLPHTVDGTSLLFNQVQPLDRVEILSCLPPKPELDQLLARFFDRNVFRISIPPIIHESTFRAEYNAHLQSPNETNLIWLALLFSILGIVMLEYHQHGSPASYKDTCEALFHLYRTRTAQCLLAGDIAKCQPYTLEALRLNATAELNRKDDNRRGLWIMTGVIMRVGVNMGYHFDPGDSPSISPFVAEYRRRVWLSVVSMDDMASLLTGFPRAANSLHATTREPRNVHDWELVPGLTVLPASRSMEDTTSVTYMIAKGRLSRALGRVTDFNNDPRRNYDTLVDIDAALVKTYDELPGSLKISPKDMGTMTMGNEMTKLTLTVMYHQGVCILHRPYMARDRDSGKDRKGRYRLSRDRCISSGMTLLQLQGLFKAQPAVYKMAQARQLVMLAGMVLVLELEVRKNLNGDEDTMTGDVTDDALMAALEKSCECWREVQGVCDEASKAAKLMFRMLRELHRHNDQQSNDSNSGIGGFGVNGFDSTVNLEGVGIGFDSDFPSINFDWATWDTFIDGTAFDSGPIY